MNNPYFQQLGFTDNEVKIYLSLAEVGKSSAQLLAKRSRVPRTTAYSVLESLVSKGVVSEEQKKGTTYFSANSPESIRRIVEEHKEELVLKENAAELLIKAIKPYFTTKNFSVPNLQFFEGRSNVRNLLYNYYPEWQESLAKYDSTWWGYQDHSFVEEYYEWLEWHWPKRIPGEKIHLLSNRAPVEEKLEGKVLDREIRQVPLEYPFSSTIWVIGDFIVLLMTKQEPHYAFQMRDAVFSQNLRSVFQLLWHTGF